MLLELSGNATVAVRKIATNSRAERNTLTENASINVLERKFPIILRSLTAGTMEELALAGHGRVNMRVPVSNRDILRGYVETHMTVRGNRFVALIRRDRFIDLVGALCANMIHI